jgi:hypothetical protein
MFLKYFVEMELESQVCRHAAGARAQAAVEGHLHKGAGLDDVEDFGFPLQISVDNQTAIRIAGI